MFKRQFIGLIGLCPFLLYGQVNNLESGTQKTTVEIKATDMISTLELHENIIISAKDVTDAKVDNLNKTFELGTFCTSTNNPEKYLNIVATNNEGKFEMLGENGVGDVPYTILLNKQKLTYGQPLKFFPQGENKHVDCNVTETIQITIDAVTLAKAKAGTYDVSLNLALANLN